MNIRAAIFPVQHLVLYPSLPQEHSMKNSTKLAIAALMAGSLSLSSLPVADAQEPAATTEVNGVTYYLNKTGDEASGGR